MRNPRRPPNRITRREDGRWMDGDATLLFGIHASRVTTRGPFHIFKEVGPDDRSICGKVSRLSKSVQVHHSLHSLRFHPACRLCNYTGHFGNYGDTVTTTASRYPACP